MTPPDFSWHRFLFPTMHREGSIFVVGALLITILIAYFWLPFLLPGLLSSYAVFLFFRDPERVLPRDKGIIVSPADGSVCALEEVTLPAELRAANALAPLVWRVSVFMSVLDVHVNRMPFDGTITFIKHIPGKFLNAAADAAVEDNERVLYLIHASNGATLACVQIAGLIARRIVTFVKEGQSLQRGERLGLIRFGSRVDIYLPPQMEPEVVLGQIMVAGETPLARFAPNIEVDPGDE